VVTHVEAAGYHSARLPGLARQGE